MANQLPMLPREHAEFRDIQDCGKLYVDKTALFPDHLKFLLVCTDATLILPVTYQFGLRYTIMGRKRNGPRRHRQRWLSDWPTPRVYCSPRKGVGCQPFNLDTMVCSHKARCQSIIPHRPGS